MSNYDEIKKWIEFGDKNRAVDATAMNKTSSRSHTVFTVEIKKITKRDGMQPLVVSAEINLVDLAGSEKSGQAKTSGDRLAEGNAINLSLSALGNVITALASNSKAAKKKPVPYRDSVLTRMLSQALGGNSSTIMVCAIRPGMNYYDETLNTLKYADRAKQIKNAPKVNENPQDKIIRDLKEENERLQKMIADMQAGQNVALAGSVMKKPKQEIVEDEEEDAESDHEDAWFAEIAQAEDAQALIE